jgi:hypothetical protein
MGCVSIPILALIGKSVWLMRMVFSPIGVALQGCRGQKQIDIVKQRSV